MNRIWIICIVALFLSCQKAPQRSCFKSTGKPVQLIQQLDPFIYLHIGPYIEVELIQDSLNYIEWNAGQNLISFLIASVNTDTLYLQNKNKCRFLRYAKGEVKASVHFTSIHELHLANSEKVSASGTWSQDDLLLYLHEGVGVVDLQLDVQKTTVRNNYGWQQLVLSGQAKGLFVDLDGSAALDARELHVSDSISFRSSSLLTSYIWADQLLLKAQLYGAGNLYYSGNPLAVLKKEYGQGRVLQQ
ncbi:MAG: hypothetical protein RLZZ211_146 [Bacteroidota bacterium]|jgi:hypothetical protein